MLKVTDRIYCSLALFRVSDFSTIRLLFFPFYSSFVGGETLCAAHMLEGMRMKLLAGKMLKGFGDMSSAAKLSPCRVLTLSRRNNTCSCLSVAVGVFSFRSLFGNCHTETIGQYLA